MSFLFFLSQIFFNFLPQGEILFPAGIVQVEVADSPLEQQRGLMDRMYLSEDHGMIFVYQDSHVRTFWMKNTLLPLDMIFFDASKKIVDIKKNVQPCRQDPCEIYPSKKPAQYVLEMKSGSADRLGLRENGSASIILPYP